MPSLRKALLEVLLKQMKRDTEEASTPPTPPSLPPHLPNTPLDRGLWKLATKYLGNDAPKIFRMPSVASPITEIQAAVNLLQNSFALSPAVRQLIGELRRLISTQPTKLISTFAAAHIRKRDGGSETRIIWNERFVKLLMSTLLPLSLHTAVFLRNIARVLRDLTPPQGVDYPQVLGELLQDDNFKRFVHTLTMPLPTGKQSRQETVAYLQRFLNAFVDAFRDISTAGSWLRAQLGDDRAEHLRKFYKIPSALGAVGNWEEVLGEILGNVGISEEDLQKDWELAKESAAAHPDLIGEFRSLVAAILLHEYLHILAEHIRSDMSETYQTYLFQGAAGYLKRKMQETQQGKRLYGVDLTPADSETELVLKIRKIFQNAPSRVRKLVDHLVNEAEDYQINSSVILWLLGNLGRLPTAMATLNLTYNGLFPFRDGLEFSRDFPYYARHVGETLGEVLWNYDENAIEDPLRRIGKDGEDGGEEGEPQPGGEEGGEEGEPQPGGEGGGDEGGDGVLLDILQRVRERQERGGGETLSDVGEDDLDEEGDWWGGGEEGEDEREGEEEKGEGEEQGQKEEEQPQGGEAGAGEKEEREKEEKKPQGQGGKGQGRDLREIAKEIADQYLQNTPGTASAFHEIVEIAESVRERDIYAVRASPPKWYEEWMSQLEERIGGLPPSAEIARTQPPYGISGPPTREREIYDPRTGRFEGGIYSQEYTHTPRVFVFFLMDISGSMEGIYHDVARDILRTLGELANAYPVGGRMGHYKLGGKTVEVVLSAGVADTQLGAVTYPNPLSMEILGDSETLLRTNAGRGGGTDMLNSVREVLAHVRASLETEYAERLRRRADRFISGLRDIAQGGVPFIHITVATDGDTNGISIEDTGAVSKMLKEAQVLAEKFGAFVHIVFVLYVNSEREFRTKVQTFKVSLQGALPLVDPQAGGGMVEETAGVNRVDLAIGGGVGWGNKVSFSFYYVPHGRVGEGASFLEQPFPWQERAKIEVIGGAREQEGETPPPAGEEKEAEVKETPPQAEEPPEEAKVPEGEQKETEGETRETEQGKEEEGDKEREELKELLLKAFVEAFNRRRWR